MNLNRIGLLDDEENPLVDPQSALAQYQPQQVATAPQKPQGISLLQRLGMAFIPETMDAISNAKAQQAAPVDGGYEALAEYWAKQGNPEKAKQYMELSGIGVDERFGATFEAGDGNTYQLRKGADPVLIGRTAKEKSDAGHTEEGLPLTETKPGKLPVGWFWNPITNSAERIPGLPIKPEQQPAAPKPGGSASPKPPKPPKPAGDAGVAKPEKQTADIRAAKGFLGRMRNAESIIDTMGESAYPTLTTSATAGVPLIGDFLKRKSQTPEQQKYHNASMEWVRAKLRKESGAVIGKEEAIDEYNTYFPVYGDDPDAIRLKKILRAEAIRSMQTMAGETDSPAPRPSVQLPPLSAIQAERDRRKKLRGGK